MEILNELQQELHTLKCKHHVATIKSNCLIRDFLAELYPAVNYVDIRHRDVVVHISRPVYPITSGHEIYIRDDNWRDTSVFEPKLNWFGSEISANETSYLNYIEVLGYIGTQFKTKDSEFMKLVGTQILDYDKRKLEIDSIEVKASNFVKEIKQQQLDNKRTEFYDSLESGNYYIKLDKNKAKKELQVVKINKINNKTVDTNLIEKLGSNDVNSKMQLIFDIKRIKKEDLYTKTLGFELVSKSELDKIVLEVLIYNELSSKLYWDGINSLNDPFTSIVLLIEKKLIPYNNITPELDKYINNSIEEIKEIKNAK